MANFADMLAFLPMITMQGVRDIAIAGYVVIAVWLMAKIVYHRTDPVKSLAWITVIALIPVAGMILYVVFGRNYRKEKIFSRKEVKDLEQLEKLSREQLDYIHGNHRRPLPPVVEQNCDIITLLLNNNKALLTIKNRVKILNNGKETFAAILEALRAAEHSIHIEYYIFDNDRIGKKVSRLLMEKARQGVEVRFIYDDVGSWGLSRRFIGKLRAAGVHTGCFMPVAFPWLTSRVNYRNHRKIIVVDGQVGFTGGINIAERYVRGNHLGRWRDTHLQIEGEAVRMLQGVFMLDWYFVSGRQLDYQRYLPANTVTEESPMQIASSGPDSDWASIMQAFFAAITKARRHIHISSPYFLPNQAILTALKVAALSGIDVKVLIPSRSDSKIVYWATRSYIGELIEAGIKVYLYHRGFNHSKIVLIDGNFSSVGTANMDIRSFEDNFEVSAIMYDPAIAAELEGYFQKDLEGARQVTYEVWENRPVKHKIYESISRLFSPLL